MELCWGPRVSRRWCHPSERQSLVTGPVAILIVPECVIWSCQPGCSLASSHNGGMRYLVSLELWCLWCHSHGTSKRHYHWHMTVLFFSTKPCMDLNFDPLFGLGDITPSSQVSQSYSLYPHPQDPSSIVSSAISHFNRMQRTLSFKPLLFSTLQKPLNTKILGVRQENTGRIKVS